MFTLRHMLSVLILTPLILAFLFIKKAQCQATMADFTRWTTVSHSLDRVMQMLCKCYLSLTSFSFARFEGVCSWLWSF